MDKKAMYKLTYGLFVLTARDGEKDNGCIINTAMQVTTTPNRMIVVVNKQNYTHDMIQRTKKFNVSVRVRKRHLTYSGILAFRVGKTQTRCRTDPIRVRKTGLCT